MTQHTDRIVGSAPKASKTRTASALPCRAAIEIGVYSKVVRREEKKNQHHTYELHWGRGQRVCKLVRVNESRRVEEEYTFSDSVGRLISAPLLRSRRIVST